MGVIVCGHNWSGRFCAVIPLVLLWMNDSGHIHIDYTLILLFFFSLSQSDCIDLNSNLVMEVKERKVGIKDRGWWGQQQNNRINDFEEWELIWKDLIRERKKSRRKKSKFKIENETKQNQFYQRESIPRLVLIGVYMRECYVCRCETKTSACGAE